MRFKEILLILICVILCSCAAAGAEGLKVVCTDFPCYDFARAVLDTDENITLLIKPGTEAHSYDPTPADIVSIMEADIFVYIGGESDSWVDSVLESMGSDAPALCRMMDSVNALTEEISEGMQTEVEGEDGGEYDEHIWTDPKNAALMVRALENIACETDAENTEMYRANASSYIEEIDAVDARLTAAVDTAKRRVIIVGDRFPFLYLARAYDIKYYAAFPGCARETEPSAQTVMFLIDKAATDNIGVIYKIELSTGLIAQTVADAVGADILTLHSIENVTLEEFDGGETYVSLMLKNADALEKGLN